MIKHQFLSPHLSTSNIDYKAYTPFKILDKERYFDPHDGLCLSSKLKLSPGLKRVEQKPCKKRFSPTLKKRMHRFCCQFIECAKLMIKMKLTSDILVNKNVFPSTPYFRPKSKLLIECVKKGDIDTIYKLLSKDRFLVYDFDNVKQTCLHWAAKRNKPEIIKVLLHFGAYIDAKDSGNRTPLYLASKMGNIRCVKVLLANEADTQAKTFMNYTAFTVAKTPEILSYLKKGYMIKFARYFYSKSQWEKMFKNEVLNYFENKEDIGIYYREINKTNFLRTCAY